MVVPELNNDFLAQPFDIKGVTANKMFQSFNRLGWTDQAAGAAGDGFVCFAQRDAVTFRAMGRKGEGAALFRAGG